MSSRKQFPGWVSPAVIVAAILLSFGVTFASVEPPNYPQDKCAFLQTIPYDASIDPYSNQLIQDLVDNACSTRMRFNIGSWTQSTYYVNGNNYQLEDVYLSESWYDMGHWLRDVPFPTDQSLKCTDDSDGNFSIIDTARGMEWNLWAPNYNYSTLELTRNSSGYYEARNGGAMYLEGSGSTPVGNAHRGCGIALSLGTVFPGELAAGTINHALCYSFTEPAADPCPPATKNDGGGTGSTGYPNRLPEAAAFRLKPSVWTDNAIENSGWNHTEKALAYAARDYGMYVTDYAGCHHIQGNHWRVYGYDPYLSIPGCGMSNRESSGEVVKFWPENFLSTSNFEVLDTIHFPYPQGDQAADYDGDGIINAAEVAWGYRNSTYYDQVDDSSNGPLDWDSDGLTNAEECELRSHFRQLPLNPYDSDSDGDGYTDYEEAYDWSADPTNYWVTPDPSWPGMPSGTNLALNKSASSTFGGTASNAVDGNDNTACQGSQNTGTLTVDLGSVQDIDRVILKWFQRKYYGARYTVQVSNNGSSWTTVYTENRGSGGIDDIWGLGASGRYVRVNVTAAGSAWAIWVHELQVYGPGAPQAPVANFSGNPTSGDSPLTVNFTDLSTNSPTSWSWTFGDGGTSTARHPSHIYTSSGDYTVSLTATNSTGSDGETKTNYISVTTAQAPVANFSGSPTSGASPLTVNFTDLSTNSPTAWSWTFGDGGSSTAQNPSHQYTSTGDYTVSLTATNAGGSDGETKTNYISVSSPPQNPPVANFSGSPTSGYAPLTVSFTDSSTNSPTSWSWTFGDGGSSTAQNPSHTYTSDGDYTVSLTATNAAGSDGETKTDYISVTSGGQVQIFLDDFESDTLASWTTSGTVEWYTGSPKNGTHSVRISGSGIPNMHKRTSTAGYENIVASFYIGASSLESGEWCEALWYDGTTWIQLKRIDDGAPEEDGALHYFQYSLPSGADDYLYLRMRFMLHANASDDYMYVDDVKLQAGVPGGPVAPVADFSGAPTTGVAPLAVDFTDSSTNSPTAWSWTFGDGGTSTIQNPTHEYTSAGDYTVSLTAANSAGSDGETKTDYISVSSSGPTTIFSDDFESALSGWTTSGTVNWYTGTPKNDTHSVEFIETASLERTISTAGYSSIEVSFYLGAMQLEAGENVQALWYNGSTWTVLTQLDGVIGGPVWNSYTYSLPAGAGNNPNFKLRFKVNGSWPTDYGYVDDVVVKGGTTAGNPPVADFSGFPRSGAVSLTVNFTDASTKSPTSWSWTFGDGGTSTSQNPSHTYTSAGDYDVSLTATNADGSDTETKLDYITVGAAPVAAFSGSPTTGVSPLTVNFTDSSTNSPTSWSWNFGDTGTSTAQNPSHQYTSAGIYTVSLTAANAYGSDVETKTNYITVTVPPPVANFSGSPTSGTAPLTVNFTDSSTNNPTSWSWTFGDGGSSSSQNPSHQYTSAGDYTVGLTASNAGGSDGETKTNYISVSSLTTIEFHDFATNTVGDWTTSGTVEWYSGDPKHDTHSVRISGSGTPNMHKRCSTSDYEDIVVSFYIGASSLESGEWCEALWYDDPNWIQLKRIDDGDPEEDGALHYFQYSLPAGANDDFYLRLRFMLHANSTDDYMYVDDAKLQGTPQ